jgi:hypothetical protein
MASLREQVLARVAAALLGNTPAGVQVSRSREVSITRAMAPAIVVMPASNQVTRMATAVDRNAFEFDIEIFTRGDPWDSLADPVDVAQHSILMTDATLAALLGDLRRTGESFEGLEADKTAGTLTVRYRAIYLTNARDIAAAG